MARVRSIHPEVPAIKRAPVFWPICGLFLALCSAVDLGKLVAGAKAGFDQGVEGRKEAEKTLQPVITTVEPRNGAVGAQVTIRGGNFGAWAADTIQVSFNGSLDTHPTRIDDDTIRATVPVGATTGNLVVAVSTLVGLLTSNGVTFPILKTLSLTAPAPDLVVGRTLGFAVSATDTSGLPVTEPSVEWAASSGAVRVQDGQVRASEAGDFMVTARSGALAASRGIHVYRILDFKLRQTALTLDGLPPDGKPAPGFVTAARIGVDLVASDGRAHSIAWESLAPDLATVDPSGLVRTVANAPRGKAIVRASLVDDPTVFATASVFVDTAGAVDLGIR